MGVLPSASRIGKLRNRVIKHIGNMLFRSEQAYYMQIRAALGLPRNNRPLTAQFAQYLYLQGSTESFEYPRRDLPPYVHFVGPLLPPRLANFSPPTWWGKLTGGRPVVLVTQGTLATDPNALIVPTLRALANDDLLVIATANPAKLRGIPANTHCEPFIPFMELMPFVSVLVTNGGYGGVQTALAHGVPIVAAGATEDKPEIANRIQWSGVGLNLKTATPTTEQIHSAVKTTLFDSRYRQNAQRIQVDIARHNSPAEAAALLEQLAVTRQPVHRDSIRTLAGTATR